MELKAQKFIKLYELIATTCDKTVETFVFFEKEAITAQINAAINSPYNKFVTKTFVIKLEDLETVIKKYDDCDDYWERNLYNFERLGGDIETHEDELRETKLEISQFENEFESPVCSNCNSQSSSQEVMVDTNTNKIWCVDCHDMTLRDFIASKGLLEEDIAKTKVKLKEHLLSGYKLIPSQE